MKIYYNGLALVVIGTILSVLSISCSQQTMTEGQVEAYVQAKGLYLTGDYRKALETLSTEAFSPRKGHQGVMLAAKCHFLSLEPAKAEPLLRSLLKKYPEYTDARIWLVRTYLAQEKFDEAGHAAEFALQFDSDDPRLLYLTGSLMEATNERQKAFEYYARAAAYGDEVSKAELSLAQMYYRFDQRDKALLHIGRARSMCSPSSPLALPLAALENKIAGETE